MRQVNSDEGKNAILITIESTREDVARSIGFLEGLRTRGKKFSYAFSTSSWTTPSVLSILTSTYPMMYAGNLRLQPPRKSISEVLSEKGYFTAGFAYHPYLPKVNGYGRGFEVYRGSFTRTSSIYGARKERMRRLNKQFFHNLFKIMNLLCEANLPLSMRGREYLKYMERYKEYLGNPELAKVPGEIVNKEVIGVLSRIKQQNFFIWIHYWEPHFPFLPPLGHLPKAMPRKKAVSINAKIYAGWVPGRKVHIKLPAEDLDSINELYKSEVRVVNSHIYDLIRDLESLRLLDNTGVFITSDHGEAFYEHRRFSHQFDLYDELIHIPLWIVGSGAGEINGLVSLVDLAPTIVDFLGFQKSPYWIGRSMLNTDYLKRRMVISEATEDVGDREIRSGHMNISKRKISARSRFWKYIYNEAGHDELYNLEEDPQESTNLVDERPKIAYKMKKSILAHIDWEIRCSNHYADLIKKCENVTQEERETRSLFSKEDEERIKKRLRALGYID